MASSRVDSGKALRRARGVALGVAAGELELDGEEDPDADRLLAAAGGLEAEVAGAGDGGGVEAGVAAGPLDDRGVDRPALGDEEAEEGDESEEDDEEGDEGDEGEGDDDGDDDEDDEDDD